MIAWFGGLAGPLGSAWWRRAMADRRKVATDHDHSCCPAHKSCQVCRRGLACLFCNSLIAFAFDDPARLRRIAGSLEAAKAAVQERQS